MTESAAVGTRGFNSPKQRKYASVGLLAPNMHARIVDQETGCLLPPGSSGELWLHGPGIMKGTIPQAPPSLYYFLMLSNAKYSTEVNFCYDNKINIFLIPPVAIDKKNVLVLHTWLD
jgi:acyl-CoA synthetase (AMP-forming)/AMP-acid ligase II